MNIYIIGQNNLNIKMLINRIVKDFGTEFIITMAPISSSLITDGSSMAGFNYKELYNQSIKTIPIKTNFIENTPLNKRKNKNFES